MHVLDVATGTGDVAIALSQIPEITINAVDLSTQMLAVQATQLDKLNLNDRITLGVADAEKLPFDAQFDAVTVAFGIRNFAHLDKGLQEMYRVLHPNGCLYILETSRPKKFPMKQGFGIYSKYIMPTIGNAISKDSTAYTYLPESVEAFPEGKDFENILIKVGYKNIKLDLVSGGIATIYSCEK